MRIDVVEFGDNCQALYVDCELIIDSGVLHPWEVVKALEDAVIESGELFFAQTKKSHPKRLEDVVLLSGLTVQETWDAETPE
jgi:glycine/D-amino acid oxidase-like deaminating enzyme